MRGLNMAQQLQGFDEAVVLRVSAPALAVFSRRFGLRLGQKIADLDVHN